MVEWYGRVGKGRGGDGRGRRERKKGWGDGGVGGGGYKGGRMGGEVMGVGGVRFVRRGGKDGRLSGHGGSGEEEELLWKGG